MLKVIRQLPTSSITRFNTARSRKKRFGIPVVSISGMKETHFYIVLQLKTPEGFEPFGKFFVSSSRAQAEELFGKLLCRPRGTDGDVLQLDLVETGNGLPHNLQVLSCNLDNMAENCRIIIRECFKFRNLE